jgi:hypothetical protein
MCDGVRDLLKSNIEVTKSWLKRAVQSLKTNVMKSGYCIFGRYFYHMVYNDSTHNISLMSCRQTVFHVLHFNESRCRKYQQVKG